MSGRHYVYWLCDDTGVIYVGYTTNLLRRIAEHKRTKDWFREVQTVDVHRYDSQHVALKEEAISILFGERLYNKQMSNRLAIEAFREARQGIRYKPDAAYENVPVRNF